MCAAPFEPALLQRRLGPWLEAKVGDWCDVRVDRVELQRGSGSSAEIFFTDVRYRDPTGEHARRLVVRRQPETYALVLGGDLALQARVMSALDRRPGIRVPECFGMESDREVLGAPFLVMEQIEGRTATQSPNYNAEGWLAELPESERGKRWRNAIEALAVLHRIDWQDGFEFLNEPAPGEAGLDRYLDYLERWHHWAARGRRLTIADAALEYLLENRPNAPSVHVLWGDPTPFNVVFRPDGSVEALLDWELAALGPAEMDLAWWLFFDELFSDGFDIPRLPGLPSRRESIEVYEAAVGRSVENLDYYDILTAMRMAIISLRQVDRQIGLGRIPADNKSIVENPMSQYLARKLHLEVPELGPDYAAFTACLSKSTDD